jgi:hypothetical protein
VTLGNGVDVCGQAAEQVLRTQVIFGHGEQQDVFPVGSKFGWISKAQAAQDCCPGIRSQPTLAAF